MSVDGPDLVVVGAGGGLVGALRAAELGLDVLVVEVSEHSRRGNNTSMSTAMIPGAGSRWQRDAGIEDSPETFVADVMAKTQGRGDERLARALGEVSGRLVEWMADVAALPMELVTDFDYPGHSAQRCHTVPGRHGTVLLDGLHAAVRVQERIDVLCPARLVDVRTDPSGAVVGVIVEAPDGARDEIPTRAVLLATNGFGADAELVREHLPEIADAVYHGSEHSRGDALRIGERLGAATAYLDAYQGHAALSVRGAALLGWATVMHGGIVVDRAGHRFGDETCGYSEYAALLAAQPGAGGWIVFDEQIHELCLPFTDYLQTIESGAVELADTPAQLAAIMEVDPGALDQELADLAAAAGGTDRFGRHVHRGLQPPLRAALVHPALFHTQGGLVVDEHARVERPDGSPIPGLYAAGGAANGISGHGASGYLAGNGLLPAFGLALLAAEHLAQTLHTTESSS